MTAMAMQTLTATERTTHVTLKIEGSGRALTHGSRAKLEGLLAHTPIRSLRSVTVTGIRPDLEGNHPTNHLTQQRANEMARMLLDAGVACGITVESYQAQGIRGPRPGQVRVELNFRLEQ